MKINRRKVPQIITTHGGARAERESAYMQLVRTVSTCLLFEDTFYEGANSIAKRIEDLSSQVTFEQLANLTLHAKETLKLRSVPLWLAVQATRNFQGKDVGELIAMTITRPDQLPEFVALYWKDGRVPLSKQAKLGLAKAFNKFDEYQLAKYDRENEIKLRDVLFLIHAKPDITLYETYQRQPATKKKSYFRGDVIRHPASLFSKLVDGTLAIPETWETLLSAGLDKKVAWEHLLGSKKLPAMALLSNLRNMTQANVDRNLVVNAMKNMRVDQILPYRFISAWRNAPAYSLQIEEAMLRATKTLPKLSGTTLLVIDVSGSMMKPLAGKTQLNRLDASCGLALHIVNTCEDVRIVTFSNKVLEVAPQRGFGLIDAVRLSQPNLNTYLKQAIDSLKPIARQFDRVIVLTDEQSQDGISDLGLEKQYLINVAPNQYGVDTKGNWKRINGFSTAVVEFIAREENTPTVWSEGE